MSQRTKDFKFYVKDVKDTGTFDGMAAVYGNVDLGGDIIEPGAFTRTIKNSGGKVPILWQHDTHEPIGMGRLQDSREGLMIKGQLVMESDVAQKALGLMKADVLTGLSIGYDTVVSEYDKERDVRRLKDLKLWEVSLVTFPMNPKAQVTAVKSRIEELYSMLQMQISEIKTGGRLGPDTREELLRIQEKISELIAAEDSAEPEPQSGVTDSDITSIFESIRNIVQ